MSEKDTGGPAFPLPLGNENIDPSVAGMTLRDYFAAKAMQGRMAGDTRWQEMDFTPINGLDVIDNEAVLAYRIADAMLKARES